MAYVIFGLSETKCKIPNNQITQAQIGKTNPNYGSWAAKHLLYLPVFFAVLYFTATMNL
jgi:hypothetical protein